MANTETKKQHIEDVDWFKKVLKWQKISIRSLDKSRDGTSWTERTIRQALQDEEISSGLLDEIAKKANVQPNYLIGKYSWTLKLPVMDEPGVRDYWIEHYLMPSSYPYILVEQERLGTYRHLLNTLLIHGVSEKAFRELDDKERHRVEFHLDRMTTKLLQHWFPEADFADRVDYYLAMEWETEADVMDALLDYLVDRGLVEVSYPDWNDDEDPFSDDYQIVD
ncbi:hypothetical protein ACUYFE_06890 [Olegusella massiliensis]|uniref:hypothetical protein n=1 Tax=Olegusella massiliensis TaxID=1776381 RepID=UPI004055685B